VSSSNSRRWWHHNNLCACSCSAPLNNWACNRVTRCDGNDITPRHRHQPHRDVCRGGQLRGFACGEDLRLLAWFVRVTLGIERVSRKLTRSAVYTITHRKLADPTARRLENFWWHIWGSDRSRLSGKNIARMFEDISTKSHALPPRRSEEDSRASLILSSSSKPPPRQSILKKPRAPSNTTGPRPTARFASPPRSGTEEGNDSGASSGSATVATEVTQGSSTSSEKGPRRSPNLPAKQFVASTPATRRRPQMTRRASSQASLTNSDTGVREGSSSGSTFRSQGSSGGSSQPERPGLSAKAAGKRPVGPASKQTSLLTGGLAGSQPVVQPVVQPPVQAEGVAQHNRATGETRAQPPEYESHVSMANNARLDYAQRSPAASSAAAATPGATASSVRSVPSPRRRETSDGRLPSQGLISSTVAGTSKVDVRGTFDFEDPTKMLASTAEAHDLPDSVALPSRQSSASLRDMMFTPTAPSPAPAVPMARSKSQLTLLLEREKEKLGGDLPSPRRRDTTEDNGHARK
jgi:hypothetical protein